MLQGSVPLEFLSRFLLTRELATDAAGCMLIADAKSTFFTMKKLFIIAIAFLLGVNAGFCSASDYSEWLSSKSYQALVDMKVTQGLFIEKVEGRAAEPKDEYRAVFVVLPEYTRGWYSHHGLSEKEYRLKAKRYRKDNFKEIWNQCFTDKDGVKRIQTVWIQK